MCARGRGVRCAAMKPLAPVIAYVGMLSVLDGFPGSVAGLSETRSLVFSGLFSLVSLVVRVPFLVVPVSWGPVS